MLIFLYVIVFLICCVYYVKTTLKMQQLMDAMSKMAVEVADMQNELREEAMVDIRDYERSIQQGVENLMSYGVEVAMKGEK